MSTPSHLEPSELGTKEYWDSYYKSDSANTPSPTASLDGWFTDVNASEKVLAYLSSPDLGLDLQSTTFLDVGTGNGEMLFLLREEGGFEGDMLGVDYSRLSIELAAKVAAARFGALASKPRFETWDILQSDPLPPVQDGFDVVLDKGTFDAISLSNERDECGTRTCERYQSKVAKLIKPGGLFVITSCNWTEPELRSWFEGHDSQLEYLDKIAYPSFSFGGHTGQSVSTLCFRRSP